MYCQVCGNRSRRRVCKDCISNSAKPCSVCGKPTPTITHDNHRTKSDKCVSCRMREKAQVIRGKTCKVCGCKFIDLARNKSQRICNDCIKITKTCEGCGNPTQRYKISGASERRFCSTSCASKSIPKETRHIASIKSNLAKWAGHIRKTHQNRAARDSNQYKDWRLSVFERDNYTCQKCGKHSGNGKRVDLHPHHIKPFATFPSLRFEVSNGITLCKECHRKEHKHMFIGKTRKNNSGK